MRLLRDVVQEHAPTLTVNVRELLHQPGAHKHVTLHAPLAGLATPMAWVPPSAPVTVDAEIESVVEGLLVTGEVSTSAVLRCARCLREIPSDVRVGVRELFLLDPAGVEDEGYAVLPGERLGLDTMARDGILLSIPAAPLCRPDCAGLCPVCGADRNVEDCGHDREPADPRWAALASLRDRLTDQGGGSDDDRSPHRPGTPPDGT